MERLWRLGVGVEAGLASVADAERLVTLDLSSRALRILIEIGEQDGAAALTVAGAFRVPWTLLDCADRSCSMARTRHCGALWPRRWTGDCRRALG